MFYKLIWPITQICDTLSNYLKLDIRHLFETNTQNEKCDTPTVLITNIRGALASKLDETKVINDDYGADVLAITDTWCTSNTPQGSFTLSAFNIYRRERQDGRQHGGIDSYIRNTIPTKQWTELNQPDLETLRLTIRSPKMPHPQITICKLYHPLCTMYHPLCTMYHPLCIVYHPLYMYSVSSWIR